MQTTDEGPDHPKKKKVRSSSFERRMNERNLRMTALHATQPPPPTIRNTVNCNNNNNVNNKSNGIPRPRLDRRAWFARLHTPVHNFQRSNRPPPRPCNPSPQRLIHAPTFTLPPPPHRFDIPPFPVFSSPPPPPGFSRPRNYMAGGSSMQPMFPVQPAPFLPFNNSFPPPIPHFDRNRPPPNFGFPPTFPPPPP